MLNTLYTNVKTNPLYIGTVIGAWLLVAVAFGVNITPDQLSAIGAALAVTLGGFAVKQQVNQAQTLKHENIQLKAAASKPEDV